MLDVWKGEDLNFNDGKFILIDKPLNWTSFDVVKKLRYQIKKKLSLKKIKVGHAGTLDPLATGLLIIATGKFTKKIEELMSLEKGYSGTITLGATTPSFDLETEKDHLFETDHLTQEELLKAKEKLTGTYSQIPPIFSAKKVDGNRAYDLARAGKEVKLEGRLVTIKRFEIDTTQLPNVQFEISCSKGTYIRSIARDFGEKLQNGGHLTALRREYIGEYSAENSMSVERFEELLSLVPDS